MAPWVKKTFVEVLPKYLFIERPKKESEPGPFDPLPSPSKQLSQHEKHEMEEEVEEEVIENCSQHSSLHKQPCPVTIAASVNSMQIYGDSTLLANLKFLLLWTKKLGFLPAKKQLCTPLYLWNLLYMMTLMFVLAGKFNWMQELQFEI